MTTLHLAQLNIGRLRYEVGDPRMADFVDNLALVNGLAERSPGFVWRYQDDSGSAIDTRPFAGDPRTVAPSPPPVLAAATPAPAASSPSPPHPRACST